MTESLYLPGDLSGLLDDWTGPVVLDGAATVVRPRAVPKTPVVWNSDGWERLEGIFKLRGAVYLDLRRPECADRALRWLAGVEGMTSTSTLGIVWERSIGRANVWVLTVGRHTATYSADGTDDSLIVPTLAGVTDPLVALYRVCLARFNQEKS